MHMRHILYDIQYILVGFVADIRGVVGGPEGGNFIKKGGVLLEGKVGTAGPFGDEVGQAALDVEGSPVEFGVFPLKIGGESGPVQLGVGVNLANALGIP